MDFELGRAAVGGLAGTIAMTVVMYMGGMMGMKMDMPMTLGTMFVPKGTAAWAMGAMAHLVMGVVFFVIYAALFQALGIRAGFVAWSALFGAVHAMLAGMVFGMMPALHPRMATAPAAEAGKVPAPGFLGTKMGTMGPVGVLAVHVVYGVVAGSHLRRLRRSAGRPTTQNLHRIPTSRQERRARTMCDTCGCAASKPRAARIPSTPRPLGSRPALTL